jgi:hypothetical protein
MAGAEGYGSHHAEITRGSEYARRPCISSEVGDHTSVLWIARLICPDEVALLTVTGGVAGRRLGVTPAGGRHDD